MARADVIVLGGGPAGIAAAVTAAGHGLSVMLLDDAPAGGGQIYKALPDSFRITDARAAGPDHVAGNRLRHELSASRVQHVPRHVVWLVQPGFVAHALGPDGCTRFDAPALVAATGTYERVIPVPGWTHPGVLGVGAATVLVKRHQILPGARTIVAGCGPLLLAAAAAIVKAGGRVPALVDLNHPADFVRGLPRLARRLDLLNRGAGWMRAIRASGTKVLWRHAVIEVLGDPEVREVVVAPVDDRWRPKLARARRMPADAVALGHGLVPSVEVTRLLGARHRYCAEAGGWIPELDAQLRTSVHGLYAVGDMAGIAGAAAAELRGRLAGLTAAHDLGRIDTDTHARLGRGLRAELRRAERFGSAMSEQMQIRDGLLDSIAPHTIVCRCEDVTRAEIDRALEEGARTLNDVKAMTRCGMGPCQGRMCGEAAAELVARRTGGRAAAGCWTPRPPLRPVPFDMLTGDYTYAEIMMQAHAPAPA